MHWSHDEDCLHGFIRSYDRTFVRMWLNLDSLFMMVPRLFVDWHTLVRYWLLNRGINSSHSLYKQRWEYVRNMTDSNFPPKLLLRLIQDSKSRRKENLESKGNYSGCHWKVYEYCFMKQKCHFQRGVSLYKNAHMLLSSSGIHTTH